MDARVQQIFTSTCPMYLFKFFKPFVIESFVTDIVDCPRIRKQKRNVVLPAPPFVSHVIVILETVCSSPFFSLANKEIKQRFEFEPYWPKLPVPKHVVYYSRGVSLRRARSDMVGDKVDISSYPLVPQGSKQASPFKPLGCVTCIQNSTTPLSLYLSSLFFCRSQVTLDSFKLTLSEEGWLTGCKNVGRTNLLCPTKTCMKQAKHYSYNFMLHQLLLPVQWLCW